MFKSLFIIILLFLNNACVPIVGGLGVVAIGSAAKEKGFGTALSDNVINVNILNALFKWDEKISKDIKINVDSGSVLLTGKVKTSNFPDSNVK